jgi:hypothetical protein
MANEAEEWGTRPPFTRSYWCNASRDFPSSHRSFLRSQRDMEPKFIRGLLFFWFGQLILSIPSSSLSRNRRTVAQEELGIELNTLLFQQTLNLIDNGKLLIIHSLH